MLKIVEDALEAEVSDALGRGYYERGGQPGRGYRSGAHLTRLKTAEGVVEYAAPQVADRIEPFLSRVREKRGQRTQALDELAVEMYAWASRARRCCAPRASASTGQRCSCTWRRGPRKTPRAASPSFRT